MNLRVEQCLRQFDDLLDESKFHPDVKVKTTKQLRRRVDAWCAKPENHDRRGIRQNVLIEVKRTLNQLRHAVRHADEHENPNVRQRAKELIRSAQSLPFDRLRERASRFTGHLKRAGHTRKENRLKRNRLIFKVTGLEVTELNSPDQLKSEGRRQQNCVAHNDTGGYYIEALRRGRSKFYRLAKGGKDIGLLELDVETRSVECVEGPGNTEVRLSRSQAIRILKKLDATADEVDTFSRVGAFSPFLNGKRIEPSVIRFGSFSYRIWCFRDAKKLVVRRKSLVEGKRSSAWSQFSINETEGRSRRFRGEFRGKTKPLPNNRLGDWESTSTHQGALSIGEFADLLVQCPEFAATVREGFYGTNSIERI